MTNAGTKLCQICRKLKPKEEMFIRRGCGGGHICKTCKEEKKMKIIYRICSLCGIKAETKKHIDMNLCPYCYKLYAEGG